MAGRTFERNQKQNLTKGILNGLILVATHHLEVVVASASGAEVGGSLYSCQDAVVLCITLGKLEFP